MSTGITKQTTEEMPEFLKQEIAASGGGAGLATLKTKVTPPRIKVIQKTAGAELQAVYNVGDVILSPSGVPVIRQLLDDVTHKPIGKSEEFLFIPLFYYPEFIITNPYQLKSQLPMIRERTLDPQSQLGRDCQVFEKRKFPCPESPPNTNYECTRSECFNFIVTLLTPNERFCDIACMSFRSGEYKTGQNFASLIMSRGSHGSKPDIFANVFAATCSLHTHKNGDPSWGLDIANPRLVEYGGYGHWVKDYDLYKYAEAQHKLLQESYNDKTLAVDYDNDDQAGVNAASAVDATGQPRY